MAFRNRAPLLLIVGIAALSGGLGLSATPQGGPPAPASQTPDPRTALVMGQVVDADTGDPIAGAIVRLAMRSAVAVQAARAGQSGANGTGPLQAVELSDSEGHFLFHDLPKGNALLSATADGYMVPMGPAGAGGGTANRPVTLGEGQRVFDHKIRLVRFATISGTILDEAGEPAVGFPVEAVKRSAPGMLSDASPTYGATTDDRGMYRISQIPPGDYLVVAPQTQMTMPVSAGDDLLSGIATGGMGGVLGDLMASAGPGIVGALGGVRVGNLMWSSGASSGVGAMNGPVMGGHVPGPPPTAAGKLFAYQTLFYPSVQAPSMATTLTLGSGENHEAVDFQLQPVPTSRVSGTVTGPTGPMKNIGVRLVPAASADASGNESFDIAMATTAADGSFTMLGVPVGQYLAKVEKPPTPDFRELMAQMPPDVSLPPGLAAMMPQGSKESLSAELSVGVGDADVTGVSLVMVPGAHISGRIEFEGQAAKPTPQVLQTLVVSVMSGSGRRGFGPVTDKVTASGDFKTAGYPPGSYTLNISPGPISAWMIKTITVGGRDVTNDVIELRGSDISDVVLTYTDQISNITGTVKPPKIGGFESVSVVFMPADYKKWFASGGMARRQPITAPGSNGAFSIGRVAPGDYLIIAVDNGALDVTQGVEFYDRLARLATRITVAEGEKKTVTLEVTKVER